VFDLSLILDACAEVLHARARELDLEQALLGIDALAELELHPLLRAALAAAGFRVLAEQRYPTVSARPRRSEGERCDIVLLHPPARHVLDPLLAGTLFAADGAEPEDALWLEVKAVGQFDVAAGVGRPNPAYSSALLHDVTADARKLSADPRIAHAAILLILLSDSEATAAHDLDAWKRRAIIDRALPVSAPLTRAFDITDRIGNRRCTTALIEVHRS
jgi:hypothetical protein